VNTADYNFDLSKIKPIQWSSTNKTTLN